MCKNVSQLCTWPGFSFRSWVDLRAKSQSGGNIHYSWKSIKVDTILLQQFTSSYMQIMSLMTIIMQSMLNYANHHGNLGHCL